MFGFGKKKHSREWIEDLSDEEWAEEREKVRSDYSHENWRETLWLFDEVKHDREDDGKPWKPPKHSEHGWYLSSDD